MKKRISNEQMCIQSRKAIPSYGFSFIYPCAIPPPFFKYLFHLYYYTHHVPGSLLGFVLNLDEFRLLTAVIWIWPEGFISFEVASFAKSGGMHTILFNSS